MPTNAAQHIGVVFQSRIAENRQGRVDHKHHQQSQNDQIEKSDAPLDPDRAVLCAWICRPPDHLRRHRISAAFPFLVERYGR